MTKPRVGDVAVMCIFVGVLLSLSSTASALRCYRCASSDGWSDCHKRAITENCASVSQITVLEKNIFLPQARQMDPACLGLSAEGTVNGVKGYAYMRQCFFNDKSMCSLIQSELPPGFNVLTCDLCTTDLCNGATSITVAFSSVLLMAAAVLTRM